MILDFGGLVIIHILGGGVAHFGRLDASLDRSHWFFEQIGTSLWDDTRCADGCGACSQRGDGHRGNGCEPSVSCTTEHDGQREWKLKKDFWVKGRKCTLF